MKGSASRGGGLVEMLLYALVQLNQGQQLDSSGLQAQLLVLLRDQLLQAGVQPPPALTTLLHRLTRTHQRRQRRRLRQAGRRQQQDSEAQGVRATVSSGTAPPTTDPAHLSRLMSILHSAHLPQMRGEDSSPSRSQDQHPRRRCPSGPSCTHHSWKADSEE